MGAVPPDGQRGWAPYRPTAAARVDRGGWCVSQESVNTPPPAAQRRPQRPRASAADPTLPTRHLRPCSLLRPALPTGGSSRRGEPTLQGRDLGSFGSGNPSCEGFGVRSPWALEWSCRHCRASPHPQPRRKLPEGASWPLPSPELCLAAPQPLSTLPAQRPGPSSCSLLPGKLPQATLSTWVPVGLPTGLGHPPHRLLLAR